MYFGDSHPRRKPSLTPMIDVVFLLLVFFMLSARFGIYQTSPLTLGGSDGEYSGPPRSVEVSSHGLRLNGVSLPIADLLIHVEPLVECLEEPLILRGIDDATTQDIIDLKSALTGAGYRNLILVE